MATTTVFVPTYNYARYLPQCLESILSQTRKPDQIFVVDDCSTDNTAKVMKQYRGKVGYIRHKKRSGNSVVTFNTGLQNAHGDYVLFVSADDWLAPKILEKEAAILDENPLIALVYAQAFNMIKGRKKLTIDLVAGKSSYIDRRQDFSLLVTRGNFIPYMTALVRSKVYKELGFFETELKFMADYEMWTRIAKHHLLAYIAEPLAYYRIHGRNLHLMKEFQKRCLVEHKSILDKLLPQSHDPAANRLRDEAHYSYHLRVATFEILANNRKKAVHSWRKAIKRKPASLMTWRTWQPFYFALKQLLKARR